MLNMETFHQLLSTTVGNQGSYLNALSAITQISPDGLTILASDLNWEEWGPAAIQPVKA